MDCKVNSLRLFVMIYLKSSTTRYTTYKAKNTPEIIIGRSCALKTYSDKSIGAINLELLYAIVYHEDIATSRAHITPRQIVSFVLFFIMVSSKVIYLSLNKINISLCKLAVNRKDTNTSLLQNTKNDKS